MSTQRVQKILAQVGFGSRRASEKLIEGGRVTVNGKKIILGSKADIHIDEIRVDGRIISKPEQLTYIAIHKPRGVISSTKHDRSGRKIILDLVPHSGKLIPVGRLDMESEGLMLLTNDGDLTYKLTHPKYQHEKEYQVLVAKNPSKKQLSLWRKGLVLEDGFRTSPSKVYFQKPKGKGAWLKIILTEGHKRQIRETARVLSLPIVKLIRVRISDIKLGNLKSKEWRYLSPEEISSLTLT